MSSQKYENMLNLALETPEEERALSESLNVGYNVNEDTWQVIIRYNGSIEFLRDYGASIIYLIANYAIPGILYQSGTGKLFFSRCPVGRPVWVRCDLCGY